MKHHHHCPKCSGRKIWIIERYRIPSTEVVDGQELAVLPHLPTGIRGIFAVEKVNPLGHFDLYLCAGCGFSELWAEGFKDLTADPKRGIRLLDTSDANEGPFR